MRRIKLNFLVTKDSVSQSLSVLADTTCQDGSSISCSPLESSILNNTSANKAPKPKPPPKPQQKIQSPLKSSGNVQENPGELEDSQEGLEHSLFAGGLSNETPN